MRFLPHKAAGKDHSPHPQTKKQVERPASNQLARDPSRHRLGPGAGVWGPTIFRVSGLYSTDTQFFKIIPLNPGSAVLGRGQSPDGLQSQQEALEGGPWAGTAGTLLLGFTAIGAGRGETAPDISHLRAPGDPVRAETGWAEEEEEGDRQKAR